MSSFPKFTTSLLFLLCLSTAAVYADTPGSAAPPDSSAAPSSPAAQPTPSPAADAAAAVSEEPGAEAEPPPAPLTTSKAGKTTESLSAYDRNRLAAAARSDEQFYQSIVRHKTTLIKETLARGEKLMQRPPFELAGRALAVAYALEPQPQLLFQIARAYQKAELENAALAFYQRFLQEDANSPQRQEASDQVASLRSRVDDAEAALETVNKEHLALGKTYYQAAQYHEAAEVYAVAYALKRSPRYLFNIGQGYRRAAEAYAAYFFYQRYLQEDPQTPVRRETEGYLVDLRTQLSQPPARTSKRSWVIGGIAIAGGVVALSLGLGLGLGLRSHEPTTDGGTIGLHF